MRLLPPRKPSLATVLFALTSGVALPLCADEPAVQTEISFRSEIAPILQEHCTACHGAKRADGGYRLDTVEYLKTPGESGDIPIISRSDASSSDSGELLARICSTDPALRMPSDSEPLQDSQIQTLKRWISAGAKFDIEDERQPLWMIIPPQMVSAPGSYSHPQPVTAMRFANDDHELWFGGYHELIATSPQAKGAVQRVVHQSQRTMAILLSEDKKYWITAGGSPGLRGEVRLTSTESERVVKSITLGTDLVLDLALHPSGKELACAMADGTIRILSSDSLETMRILSSHSDWVTQIAYSLDGAQLASSSHDKTCKVFDTKTWDILASYSGHQAAVRGIATTNTAGEWQTVGADKQWHRWSTDGAKKVAGLAIGGEPIRIVTSRDESIVATEEGRWYKIDLKGNKIERTVQSPFRIASLAMDRDRRAVAFGGLGGEIGIWNLEDGSLLRQYENPFPVASK
ncbi:c-type cytochrome domain-containing protein [Pirellulaceae bacterium SH501]